MTMLPNRSAIVQRVIEFLVTMPQRQPKGRAGLKVISIFIFQFFLSAPNLNKTQHFMCLWHKNFDTKMRLVGKKTLAFFRGGGRDAKNSSEEFPKESEMIPAMQLGRPYCLRMEGSTGCEHKYDTGY
jgi:hypothetical protein